jgi:uncharacterized protein with HEPN domain
MPRDPGDDAALIYDMLVFARKAVSFVQGKTGAEYSRDDLLRLAVERAIEIVGEASRHVSDELKAAHPEVPWVLVGKQRHVLAQDYGEIDDAKIWRVASLHLGAMIPRLETILAELPPCPPRLDTDQP